MVDTDQVMLAIGRLEGKMDAALMCMEKQDESIKTVEAECDCLRLDLNTQNTKFQTFRAKVLTLAGVISALAGGAASGLWTLLR